MPQNFFTSTSNEAPPQTNESVSPALAHGVLARAILATPLYHGIGREELCLLPVRRHASGITHFRIKGKRDKIRFVPIHPLVLRLIGE